MINTGPYSFPRIDIPESKKDKDYHRNFVLAITNRSITDQWANNFLLMQELYRFSDSGSSGELTPFLQSAADGSQLPAYWISTNTIKTKQDLLLGELEERGYEIRCKAVNGDIIYRKFDEKERLRVQRRLQKVRRQAEQMSGVSLGREEYIPQTEQELDEYMDLSYKDKAEIIVEAALKWCAVYNHWDEERKALFLDTIKVNKAIVKNEIINGVPRSKRVHPLCFISDQDSTDDRLSDATFFAEVEYMPLAKAAERYNLTNQEIEDVYNSWSSYNTTLGLGGVAPAKTSFDEDVRYGFDSIGTTRFSWFRNVDNSLRVMVVKGVWLDYKELNHKSEKKNKDGMEVEFFQSVKNPSEISKNKDKIITNKIQCWRQATIIGGQIVKEWGPVPNQPRTLDKLAETEPPYKVWIPSNSQARPVSLTERMAGLQLLKDILMFNLQVEISTAPGKIMIYDTSMLPEGWTQEQMMGYIKTAKIAFVNSKEYQLTQGNMNVFSEVDLSLTTSINSIVTSMQYIDSLMDSISGVSPERQGVVQGSSQAVGVTQAALFQSNLITAPYFKGFERFCSRVLNHQAKLIKIAFPANPEKFAPIIGETGIDFLKEHIDIEFDEFSIQVISRPPILLDRQKLEELVGIALQSQQVTLEDALVILLEPDTKAAIRKFQRKMTIRAMLQSQQEEAQAQQEQQMQMQMEQMENQRLMEQLQGQLAIQESKNRSQIQKTAMTGRVKLNSDKLKLTKP